MKEKLLSMFQDNSGGVSTMRGLLFMWIAVLTIIWLFVSISTVTVTEIPSGVVSLTGIFIGSKALQRFGEKAEEPAPPTTPTVT